MNKRQREKKQSKRLFNMFSSFGENKKEAKKRASNLKKMERDLYIHYKKNGGKNEVRRVLKGLGFIETKYKASDLRALGVNV